jgi:hypothetical protein
VRQSGLQGQREITAILAHYLGMRKFKEIVFRKKKFIDICFEVECYGKRSEDGI